MSKQKREQAILSGERFYKSGKPCRNGHDDLRYASNGTCVGCQMDKNARYAKNKPEKSSGGNGFHTAKSARVSRLELYNLLMFVRGKILQGVSDAESVYNVVSKIDSVLGRTD